MSCCLSVCLSVPVCHVVYLCVCLSVPVCHVVYLCVSVCLSVSCCLSVRVSVDMSGRSVAACRCMKRAYHSAVENAFSHLLLVVLDNGKVFVDVNSTMTDAPLQSRITPTHDQYHRQILPVFVISYMYSRELQAVIMLQLVNCQGILSCVVKLANACFPPSRNVT